MKSNLIYRPGSRTELSNLKKVLSESFTLKPERSKSASQRYFDTFDWRLFGAGFLLIQKKENFSLVQIDTGKTNATLNLKTPPQPLKTDNFPSGEFREKIYETISVRALIPSPEFKSSKQVIRLLNMDQKIVVRLFLETITAPSQGKNRTLRLLSIDPVRGYSRELRKVLTVCDRLNLSEEKTGSYFLINELLDREPGGYASKSIPDLTPEMKSREAIKLIICHALNTISQNEHGIVNDIDTEFLHDFRVSARRARSITSQFKSVFDEKTAASLKRDLTYLGKLSNNLRDLDVYLIKKDRLRRLLPADLSVHLEYLFRIMKRERNAEQKNITGVLKSDEYKKIITRLKSYVSPNFDKPEEPSKNSESTIKTLAAKIIKSDYKRVITLGRSITESTPDEEIHRLRIECKKLRYLLETFATLFPLQKISELIFRLKVLQDYLGDFNDLSVQQDRMRFYVDVLAKKDVKNKMVFAAIGGIITHLYFEQIRAREAFYNTFREFDTKINMRLINNLLK